MGQRFCYNKQPYGNPSSRLPIGDGYLKFGLVSIEAVPGIPGALFFVLKDDIFYRDKYEYQT
jgi:hypothetical protein